MTNKFMKESSLINEMRRFKQLAMGKLGNVKPLLYEQPQTQHSGESLRWEINDDKVLYFPGATTIEGRKDKKGNVKPNTKPGLQGKFIKGPGVLYFNQDYNVDGIQLNYEYNYSNPVEIKKHDCIVGTFDKGGLISGSLYKNIGLGIFGEPAWDEKNPIVLNFDGGNETYDEYSDPLSK